MAVPLPNSPIELLQATVRINSINAALPGSRGGESKLVTSLERTAQGFGLTTRRLPVPGQVDQLLVAFEAEAGAPWLLFDSHLDTVAVEGMTIEPFGGELRDGRVWGRGAADTKGTGAAMLWALRQYAQSSNGQEKPNNIALLFSVDEEVAMTGVESFVENDLPSLGFVPGAVIVGEPTELRPVVAHNGCLRWTITTHGRACHSSTPHEGRSAISAMVRVIDRLEREYIPHLSAEHPLTGPAVCSINVIRGGSAPNIIPDSCVIEIDRRLVPDEDEGGVLAEIEALLEPLRHGASPVEFTQDLSVGHSPLGTTRNGALTAHLTAVLDDLALPTLTLGAPYATHASVFDAAGLPAVVLGPGSGHTAHTKDEWVSVEQIERGVQLYEALMRCPALPGSAATG
ncbi:MAG: M20/M25/M40 family metallo-hydrolase [Planctomycetota bacterium]